MYSGGTSITVAYQSLKNSLIQSGVIESNESFTNTWLEDF